MIICRTMNCLLLPSSSSHFLPSTSSFFSSFSKLSSPSSSSFSRPLLISCFSANPPPYPSSFFSPPSPFAIYGHLRSSSLFSSSIESRGLHFSFSTTSFSSKNFGFFQKCRSRVSSSSSFSSASSFGEEIREDDASGRTEKKEKRDCEDDDQNMMMSRSSDESSSLFSSPPPVPPISPLLSSNKDISASSFLVNPGFERRVGWWLLASAGMIASMVCIGGYTRLTRSGLSMVDWRPEGRRLPSSNDEWKIEFDKYKTTPEFVEVNSEISLEEFKEIYFVEWMHRMAGRFTGLVFGLGMLTFIIKGAFKKSLLLRLGALFSLGAAQGGIGWWMVKSGLTQPSPTLEMQTPRWIPPEVNGIWSNWRNVFENTAVVQFDHRMLAYFSVLCSAALFIFARRLPISPAVKFAAHLLPAMTFVQMLLGITTLIMFVPTDLGVFHQFGALATFSAILFLLHTLKIPPGVLLKK